MVPTLFGACDLDGSQVTADWDTHRFFWIGGGAFSGKTTSAKALVEDFEAQGGEALVFIDFAPEARHFDTKLYTFTAERDMIPTVEELADERLSSAGPHTPLLIVIEDWYGEVSETLAARLLQVARHAERLNAWVVATSEQMLVAPDFSDLVPRRFFCRRHGDDYYIMDGVVRP